MEKYLYDLLNKIFLNFLPFLTSLMNFQRCRKNHKIGKKIGISKEIQSVFNLRKKWFYLGAWKADFSYLPDPSLLGHYLLGSFQNFFWWKAKVQGWKKKEGNLLCSKIFPCVIFLKNSINIKTTPLNICCHKIVIKFPRDVYCVQCVY